MSAVSRVDPGSTSPASDPPSLWRNPAFLRLWIAKTVSGVGNSITGIAIPVIASISLHATPAQMAILVFASQLPDLLFGLLAGVWVDRARRRPLLITADLGRALILAIIPLSALFGFLSMQVLWVVTFVSAALGLIFTLASVAVLPSIVRKDQLVDANTKLQISEAVLSLAGPGAAGLLIQFVAAPKAILADVGSYIASAWALGGIGATETKPERTSSGHPVADIRREIGEGIHELVRTPMLLALAISMGVIVLGGSIQMTVEILFLTRVLGFTAIGLGLLAASHGVGSLLGAAFAGRAAARWPLGWILIVSASFEGVVAFVSPIANHIPNPLVLLMSTGVLRGFAYSVFAINQISLRQRITPIHVMGRVTAARRFLIFCLAPIGAALGGWLGTVAGLQPTLVVGAVVLLGGSLIMLFSSVRLEA